MSTIKIGVGLILLAKTTGRMLVLRELRSKPEIEKKAGMISFPLETVNLREKKEDAVQRLIAEEIGTPISVLPVFFGGEFRIISNVITLASYGICGEEFIATPMDSDVEFFGWTIPRELLCPNKFVRKEVYPVITSFLELKLY